MAATKQTIVIVHGAWHTPAHYSKLRTLLEHSGHEVHIPIHPSITSPSDPKIANLSTDTAALQAFITPLIDSGKSIAVLAHSYGGQVATNALHGLGLSTREALGKKGGVTYLIYMAAFALFEGKSIIGKVRDFDHEQYMDQAFTFDYATHPSPSATTVLTGMPRTAPYMLGDSTPNNTPEEVEEYWQTLRLWSGACLYAELTCEKAAWREEGVKVAYIMTSLAQCCPLGYQRDMVERIRGEGVSVEVVELETGHCPHFTMAEAVRDAVLGWVG
ncbi:alpha/beta-hydrolase [Byssothecium circinans]|uniref:Alpha/beta-hydrolase n=1 Tax=Byssothecium circinans TaxID=147558 RepID=A0A6A5U4D3_9PLEO|nr:alpha/beta-hydrolase [Byssothecium circinans]